MNLFEILIVLLFIVFPLLQQVLGQRKGTEDADGTGEPPDEAEAARRAPAARLPEPARPAERTGEPEGWSAEWGAWPAESEAEAESTENEVESPRRQEARPRPRVVREAPTVVSLEPLRVDRKAEHARFHARPAVARPAVKPPPPRVAALIRGRAGLRSAILLAEVIGTPAGLRDVPGPPERG